MNDRAAESSFFILQTIHVFFFFFGMKFDLKKKKKKQHQAQQHLKQNSIVTKVKLNESKFQQIYCFFSKYMG